jgi:hypothetical protein
MGWSGLQTIDGGYVIVGETFSYGAGEADVYLIRLITDLSAYPKIQNSEIPLVMTLEPASPNPFNSETKLTYSIPIAGEVSLIVFDINGREVARLYDVYQTEGIYEVDFNTGQLPSGVYFARLQAGGFSQTQKLVLLK